MLNFMQGSLLGWVIKKGRETSITKVLEEIIKGCAKMSTANVVPSKSPINLKKQAYFF